MFMREAGAKSINVLVGAVLTSIALIVLEGILGSLGYNAFLWLWQLLSQSVWFWAIAGSAVGIVLIGYLFLALFRLHQEIKGLNSRSEHIIGLDNGLLRMLAILVRKDSSDDAMRLLIKKLLHDAREAFPEARKAALFLPDEQKENLSFHFSTGWDGTTESRLTRFYIGSHSHERKPGAAGEAFVRQEILVTKFEAHGSGVRATRDSYIFFGDECSRLPYNALVCVPILLDKRKPECLGVVCFDSKNPDLFDPPEVQTMLELLSIRVAVAIEIFQRLQKSGSGLIP